MKDMWFGYCPKCKAVQLSVQPTLDTCSVCYNHLFPLCSDCKHHVPINGADAACNSCHDDNAPYAAWFARMNDHLCGPEGRWADFK